MNSGAKGYENANLFWIIQPQVSRQQQKKEWDLSAEH